ncbi:MAG: cisplatin damage response ATP-dependent DNA ligase [Alphaproteobacteria bacterium]|nr:cisplatin damage response ATP-dependent DNA ligase [Alphaproteobacteria bacterium]
MILLAELMDRLPYARAEKTKVALIADYLRRASDPDRGIGLSLLMGKALPMKVKSAVISALGVSRIDPALYEMSHELIGDRAETTALIWPSCSSKREAPRLSEVHRELTVTPAAGVPALIETWLDCLDGTGRWALLKVLSGRLQLGVTVRLALESLAVFGRVDISDIEEVWHGVEPPYAALFEWLEGRGERPVSVDVAVFRPFMLAKSLEVADLESLDLASYVAEWLGNGLRVQLSARGSKRRIYNQDGEEITSAFPEIVEAMHFEGTFDGELIVGPEGTNGSFGDVTKRLKAKVVSASLLASYPVYVRLHDMIFDGAVDLRRLSFDERRRCLEAVFARERPGRVVMSELLTFQGVEGLLKLWAACRERGMAGLTLKRRDSVYTGGRCDAGWIKLKREVLRIHAVLMYVQRGEDGRSRSCRDVTLGVWREGLEGGRELVPVGKAPLVLNEEGLACLDHWVREHMLKKYGPVRQVEQALVIELGFDDVYRSTRHKAGLTLREPRALGILWDQPAEEAGLLATLERWAG